jgi:hypothetical protein
MPEDDPDQQPERRGIPLEDIVAQLVFIVIGGATIVALHEFAGLRVWLSVLLGLPCALLLFLGGAWLLGRFAK